MKLKAKAKILPVILFFCMILGCAVPNKVYATAKRSMGSQLTPQACRNMFRRVGIVPTERASILEMRIALERMGGGHPQQTGSVLDSARVRRMGYSESVGFVPMRERILNCLNALRSTQRRCTELREYLQYTQVHTEAVFGFLSIRDQLDLEDVFFSIYSDFEPDPSDNVSVAVHGAMLYKRDDEIREMFTNGTISADQPYNERREVYIRLMHEDDMDLSTDSESDYDWSSESDEDGDCESE